MKSVRVGESSEVACRFYIVRDVIFFGKRKTGVGRGVIWGNAETVPGRTWLLTTDILLLFSVSVGTERIVWDYKSLIFRRMIHKYEDYLILLCTTFPFAYNKYNIMCTTLYRYVHRLPGI